MSQELGGAGNKKVAQNQNDENIFKSLPKEFQEAFKFIPEEQKGTILRAFQMVVTKTHRGPLPAAEELRAYNDIISEGGERIMRMAEKQQDHRHALESKAINAQIRESTTGQWMGFTIGLVGLVGAIFLGYIGKEIVASFIGSVDLAGLVYVFVAGKQKISQSLKEKDQ